MANHKLYNGHANLTIFIGINAPETSPDRETLLGILLCSATQMQNNAKNTCGFKRLLQENMFRLQLHCTGPGTCQTMSRTCIAVFSSKGTSVSNENTDHVMSVATLSAGSNAPKLKPRPHDMHCQPVLLQHLGWDLYRCSPSGARVGQVGCFPQEVFSTVAP